jgi:alkylated DNA repair dioxygenase AlkB
MPVQTDLFATPPDWPEGFDYRPEMIGLDEEARLLAWFVTLAFKPFEFQGYLGKREVVSFGWRYDYNERVLRAVDPIPTELEGPRAAAARFAGLPEEDLVQALVTRYRPGTTIGWHRDRPDFEQVIGVSLKAPAVLRFRRRGPTGWERRSLEVAPRSAYRLTGPARHDWEHSLRPVEQERFSVTFRSLRPR